MQAKPGGTAYSVDSWVSAYWKVAHEAETGDAGLVFMIFADEIVDKLRDAEHNPLLFIEVYGTQYGKWVTSEKAPWAGQQVQTRVVMSEIDGTQKMKMEMKWPDARTQTGWELLGVIAEKHRPHLLPGMTSDRKIYSKRFGKGVTTAVLLFDMDATEAEIKAEIPYL